MHGWRHMARCVAVMAALLLMAPAVALATSAGDQQYIDPLSGNTTATGSPSPHTAPPASSPGPSASAPASAPAASATSGPSAPSPQGSSAGSAQGADTAPAQDQGAAPATVSTTTSATGTQPTLPYTGLNVGLCAAIGAGLLGAGLLLRRLARVP